MSSLVVRRTALAASTAALVLLATACGGSSDNKDAKADDGKTAQADKTASAAPAKALGAAELEKAALTQADVKSGKVTKLPAKDDIAQDKVKTGDAACTPLALVQSGSWVGTPAATVKRSWLADGKKPAAGADPQVALLAGLDREKAVVTLASYEDGGAEQALKDLRTAADKCAGGYTYSADGTKTGIAKVAVTQAPEGADEAFAVTQTMNADGVKAPVKAVVVRKGATVVYLPAINLAAAVSGKDFDFPTALVDAQLAKLK
ncbi:MULTISPECIES: hypothetical protein [unclassified Streptomyces]|uniref:hypothetical protein n=1 Tax=unclassified Streptomyces TaxID=2593676 RepID=UPI000C2720DE|nr:hypothetical protein [Streptomyces sp. CB01373]PJM94212.1 hypothetical protein CG719_18365 [Streptomyces sp. CB01373]